TVIRRGTPSVHVISQTVFFENGEIDYDGCRAHWQRLKEAGVGVYIGGGGSGSGHSLLRDEVDQLLKAAAEELRGHVPVRAMGVEPRTAHQMIDLVKMSEANGMEGVQIYSLDMGHGGQPGRNVMERYYDDVLSECT